MEVLGGCILMVEFVFCKYTVIGSNPITSKITHLAKLVDAVGLKPISFKEYWFKSNSGYLGQVC